MESLLFDVTFPLSQSDLFFRCNPFRTTQQTANKGEDWNHPAFPAELFGTEVIKNNQACLQNTNNFAAEQSFSSDSDLEEIDFNHSPPPPPSQQISQQSLSMMEYFPPDKVTDFKHVIYNLLVENFNNPDQSCVPFVQPCTVEFDGEKRMGFRFNENAAEHPDKKLPELYAYHIRKARLDLEDQSSIFIQDLYKFYLRACLELLGKYFQKIDKYTFLYDDDTPLFLAGTTLKQAEDRMKKMRTRARKRKTSSDQMKIKSKRIMTTSIKFEKNCLN